MSGRNCLHLAGLGALLLALSSGCIEKRSFQPVIPPPPSVPTARLPQNNAYLGSVHSPRPGALQPRFAWTAAATDEDDPLTYKLELSANRDFSGEVFEYITEDTSFSPPSPLAVSTVPPVGRRYFVDVYAGAARIESPLRPLLSYNGPQGLFAYSITGVGDVNGDGLGDIAIGDPGLNSDRGAVSMYFGVVGAFDVAADGLLDAAFPQSNFGLAVASLSPRCSVRRSAPI